MDIYRRRILNFLLIWYRYYEKDKQQSKVCGSWAHTTTSRFSQLHTLSINTLFHQKEETGNGEMYLNIKMSQTNQKQPSWPTRCYTQYKVCCKMIQPPWAWEKGQAKYKYTRLGIYSDIFYNVVRQMPVIICLLSWIHT